MRDSQFFLEEVAVFVAPVWLLPLLLAHPLRSMFQAHGVSKAWRIIEMGFCIKSRVCFASSINISSSTLPPIPPVLLLAWRRPDSVARVMSCLQSVQPKQLFVACDGAGTGDSDLMEDCLQTRSVIEQAITWPCQVERLYRDQHLGCRQGVAEAISWFFSRVEEGIILEDDVLPDPSFFPYCAELLERYRDDSRVGMVSGCTIRNLPPRDGSSYRFSRYFHVWGWACWRRAWVHYDSEMGNWPALREQHWLRDLGGERFARYWQREFDRVWTGDCDTWDYIWMLSCWAQGQVCILPAINLVDNLGFEDSRATHTTLDRSPLPKSGCIQQPLRHPSHRFVDHAVDALDLARYYAPHLPQRMLRRVQKEVRRLRHAVLRP